MIIVDKNTGAKIPYEINGTGIEEDGGKKKMIIVDKNTGAKIPYEINGNKITFNDELSLNLEKYERDDAAHIDICRDKYGNLVTGVIPGMAEAYIAQVDIPPREYDYIADGTDENGNPVEVPMPEPFNIDKCTLTLWALTETEE